MNTFNVYLITFPNGKQYVGYTSNLNRRKLEHERLAKSKSDFLVHKAINKYGIENITWAVLETTEIKSIALSLEETYIDYYNSYENGYNMTKGGEGWLGGSVEDYMSEEAIIEKRRKSSKTKTGVKHSKPHCEAISKGLRGRKRSEEEKKAIAKGCYKRPVIAYLNDKEVGKYKSIRECTRELGLEPSAISKCLSGKQKSHKGYRFK